MLCLKLWTARQVQVRLGLSPTCLMRATPLSPSQLQRPGALLLTAWEGQQSHMALY